MLAQPINIATSHAFRITRTGPNLIEPIGHPVIIGAIWNNDTRKSRTASACFVEILNRMFDAPSLLRHAHSCAPSVKFLSRPPAFMLRKSLSSRSAKNFVCRLCLPRYRRHSTATPLLRAGVVINTIRGWLGYASINTTNVYAEVDLDAKAKVLAACSRAIPSPLTAVGGRSQLFRGPVSRSSRGSAHDGRCRMPALHRFNADAAMEAVQHVVTELVFLEYLENF